MNCCLSRLNTVSRTFTCLFILLLTNVLTAFYFTHRADSARSRRFFRNKSIHKEREMSDLAWIFVITPTHRRLEQKADMTRLAQTLKLVPFVHWIVVEDERNKTEVVGEVLRSSAVPYTHLLRKDGWKIVLKNGKYTKKHADGRLKGRTPRALAITWLRETFSNATAPNGVVYFADDDNTYDYRLFNDFVRRVRGVGVWAVGLVGGAIVEAPMVQNDRVVGFNVVWGSTRRFPIDMAGFGINLRLILQSSANFDKRCAYKITLETCFLEQLNITWTDLEPFGLADDDKRVYVWHTKTKSSGAWGNSHGFIV